MQWPMSQRDRDLVKGGPWTQTGKQGECPVMVEAEIWVMPLRAREPLEAWGEAQSRHSHGVHGGHGPRATPWTSASRLRESAVLSIARAVWQPDRLGYSGLSVLNSGAHRPFSTEDKGRERIIYSAGLTTFS